MSNKKPTTLKMTKKSPTVSEPIDPTYPEASATVGSLKDFPWLMPKVNAFISIYNNSRIGRSMARYSTNRGALLAGGITYVALFSITAILTISVTIVMKILGGNPRLQYSVFASVNKQLPGVLAIDGNKGMIAPEKLVITSGFSIAGIIGIIVLILSASRLMSAIKRSIRAMFGIERPSLNFVNDQLRDFLGLMSMFIAVIFTGISSALNSTAGTYLLQLIGFDGGFARFAMRVASLLLAAVADALVLWIMIRVVACVHVPKKDAIPGLALGMIIAAVLRFVGTSAVGSVDSPMLVSFAALITVLLWVNLLSRMLLIVSAFMANPPRSSAPITAEHIHGDATPNYVSLSDPSTLAWPHHSISGAIDLDWHTNPHRPDSILMRNNYRGGIIGRYLLRRLRRTQQKEEKLRAALRR
ncbi:MAG: YhjD/YihY/BrkB family envelope integrity protein [Actinomycetaceae bacterium]|nr:YhjD/YihY/BrkB family envelope integrity protein [Actinomycetaceae bacterium]